jgi:hypothetical protein
MSDRQRLYEPEALPDDGNSIRLLRIHAASSGALLSCSLERARLSDNVPYEALSYVWGNARRSRSILLQSTGVRVSDSLGYLLERVRFPDQDRLVWVDSLCINQSDPSEKSSQVQMMGKIFSGATRVIAWLGHSCRAERAMRFLTDGSEEEIVQTTLNEFATGKSPSGLFALLTRPFWTRRWIIQELVLARSIVLWCRHETMESAQLTIIFDLMRFILSQDEALCRKVMISRCQMLSENYTGFQIWVMRGKLAFQSESGLPRLYDLLRPFHFARCKQIPDKIYAFLDICSEGQSNGLQADYCLSPRALYYQVLQLWKASRDPSALEVLRVTLRLSYDDLFPSKKIKDGEEITDDAETQTVQTRLVVVGTVAELEQGYILDGIDPCCRFKIRNQANQGRLYDDLCQLTWMTLCPNVKDEDSLFLFQSTSAAVVFRVDEGRYLTVGSAVSVENEEGFLPTDAGRFYISNEKRWKMAHSNTIGKAKISGEKQMAVRLNADLWAAVCMCLDPEYKLGMSMKSLNPETPLCFESMGISASLAGNLRYFRRTRNIP